MVVGGKLAVVGGPKDVLLFNTCRSVVQMSGLFLFTAGGLIGMIEIGVLAWVVVRRISGVVGAGGLYVGLKKDGLLHGCLEGMSEEWREKEGMLHGCLDGISESGVSGSVVFCASHSSLSRLNSLVFSFTATCRLFNLFSSNSFWYFSNLS